MPDIASELLETCEVAEDTWEQASERTLSLRAEIDRLWTAYARVLSSGAEDVDEYLLDMLSLSAQIRLSTEQAARGRARTDTLLAAWREAEHALSRTEPGTLPWLLACRGVEAARDAYHSHVDRIDVSDAVRDLSFGDLHCGALGATGSVSRR
jgi:hypothetical protein